MSGAMGGAAGGVGEATGTVGDSGADVRVHWVTAFLDRPVAAFGLAADFWCAALGATLSARRGENGEFATLLPTDGDAAIKLQGVGDPCQGGHLDLEVPDVVAARDRAVGLGARSAADLGSVQVLRSPAGLLFCFVPLRSAGVRPPVVETPGGRVRADQVALDVGPASAPAEVEFWAALTGWRVVASVRPEFTVLIPPPELAIRLLVQRLDTEPSNGPRMHLDLACADVSAATAYHRSLGAQVVAVQEFWTVLRDPAGEVYCLTARDPSTGRLPGH